MPKFDGVTVALISQYDACTVPEYPPPSTKDPFVESPPLFDSERRVVSVYTPTYPCSQFWIAYQVLPEEGDVPCPYYYFKLYVDGRHIVSWGSGRRQEYRGKTMFALYRTPNQSGGDTSTKLETRAMYFDADTNRSALDSRRDTLELRVFRCRGRMKQKPQATEFRLTTAAVFDIHRKSSTDKEKEEERAVGLFNAGPLMGNQPQNFYKYSLLDPVDQPFVTFRYFLRSIDQLSKLAIITVDAKKDAVPKNKSPGPSKLFPSLSMQSIATSIASDTDVSRSLPYPLTIDSQKSPSPLRIPPILAIKKQHASDLGQQDGVTSRHDKWQDSSYEFMTPTFAGFKASRALYLNENSILATQRSIHQIDDKEIQPVTSEHKNSQSPSMIGTSRLQPKASREQMFRECVSELLGQTSQAKLPQVQDRHDVMSSMSTTEDSGNKILFGTQTEMAQPGSPLRIVGSKAHIQTSHTQSARKHDKNADEILDSPSRLMHQTSMDSLKYALRSALSRSAK